MPTDDCNPVLLELLAQEILASPQQCMTFARYMELVLYQSQQGYYASQATQIGAGGDFFTSPHLGADFGELLAAQFVDMWQALGCPARFTLVEMGAGQGLIAADVLAYLQNHYPDFFAALDYIIVEKAQALIAAQRQRLSHWVQHWGNLHWLELNDLPAGSITGCFFSNELVDAFPVHQVVAQRGQLQEVFVTVQPDSAGSPGPDDFQEVIAELSTAQLRDYFSFIDMPFPGDSYPEGYRTEVNLAALDWLAQVSDRLHQGYLLTIDYGYPAKGYYSPARTQGTLQCYYHHATNANPFANIGHQDITAHVDFTALERQAEKCGLVNLGFTQQGPFLMALGLGDRLLTNNSGAMTTDIAETLRRREAFHQLMHPLGLGGFGVLVQAKGLTTKQQSYPLKGLHLP